MKKELGDVVLQNIDKDQQFRMKCDALEETIMSLWNEMDKPVEFEQHKLDYPPTAIFEIL